MTNRHVDYGRQRISSGRGMRGYSLVEVIIALAIVAVMTAISLPYLFSNTRRYKSEDQAIQVMDLMREAGQTALSRRRTIRAELDASNPSAPVFRIIDDTNATFNKTIPLEPINQVRMDTPAGFTPPSPPNYPAVAYTGNVWRLWFTSGGTILNGPPPGGAPVSATLYSWRPIMERNTPFNISNMNPARREEVRAITVEGGRGAVRYWKFTGTGPGWAASL